MVVSRDLSWCIALYYTQVENEQRAIWTVYQLNKHFDNYSLIISFKTSSSQRSILWNISLAWRYHLRVKFQFSIVNKDVMWCVNVCWVVLWNHLNSPDTPAVHLDVHLAFLITSSWGGLWPISQVLFWTFRQKISFLVVVFLRQYLVSLKQLIFVFFFNSVFN